MNNLFREGINQKTFNDIIDKLPSSTLSKLLDSIDPKRLSEDEVSLLLSLSTDKWVQLASQAGAMSFSIAGREGLIVDLQYSLDAEYLKKYIQIMPKERQLLIAEKLLHTVKL